eukprot:scaffold12307_cov102-Skeletonema_dohrnii-CCMP3373.AAC.1
MYEEIEDVMGGGGQVPFPICRTYQCRIGENFRESRLISARYVLRVASTTYLEHPHSMLNQTEDAALEKLGMFEIALEQLGTKSKTTKVCSSEPTLTLMELEPRAAGCTSVVKKSKTSRKKGCGQAVGIVLLLSSFVVSILFFETSDMDQLSFHAIPVEVSRTMENLFGSSPGQEVEEVEQEKEKERVMVQQQPQAMIHEEPPVENHEYDQLFVQAFRNNQKISQRLNKDPMRQRMMIKSGNNVEHSMDKVAQVRIQEFRDNQRLALEGAHLTITRRRLNESENL